MNEQVTMEDPEIKALYEQILKSADAYQKREQLGEQSFKAWLIKTTSKIAEKLGYYIQDLAVFVGDMNYSIKKGFRAGREEARKKSIRYYEGDE